MTQAKQSPVTSLITAHSLANIEETAKQTGEVTRLQREQSDQRYNEIKTQLESAKADAREALDFEANDAADAALKKLEETNAKEEEKAPAVEPDIFLNFRAENPAVDHNSPDFNSELNTKVELAVNAALRSGTITTEYQLMKVMDKALDDATPKAKVMPKARIEQTARQQALSWTQAG